MVYYLNLFGTIFSNIFDENDVSKNKEIVEAIPNVDRIRIMNALYDEGNEIVYWTVRFEDELLSKKNILMMFRQHEVKFSKLLVGSKPSMQLNIGPECYNSESFFNGKLKNHF